MSADTALEGTRVSDAAWVEANCESLADVVAMYRELREARAKLAELGPDLLPYFDWPVSVEKDEVWCDKPGCAIGDCGRGDEEDRAWIASRYGLTARGLLAGIKAHAGTWVYGDPAPDGSYLMREVRPGVPSKVVGRYQVPTDTSAGEAS